MNDKELLFELKQSLKEDILSEMTAPDAEAIQMMSKQHCRLFKLFCRVWYGNLYRDGVCVRCGSFETIKK